MSSLLSTPEEIGAAPLPFLNPKEVAAYLRIPLPTVYFYLKNNKLPGIQRIGGRWRVDRRALDEAYGLAPLETDAGEPLDESVEGMARYLESLGWGRHQGGRTCLPLEAYREKFPRWRMNADKNQQTPEHETRPSTLPSKDEKNVTRERERPDEVTR